MEIGFGITRHGQGDDSSLSVKLTCPGIEFSATVYVNDLELEREARRLQAWLQSPGSRTSPAAFSFGPTLSSSPHCKVTLKPECDKRFIVRAHAVATIPGSSKLMNAGTIHFGTTFKSISLFVADLMIIASGSQSSAAFEGDEPYAISDNFK